MAWARGLLLIHTAGKNRRLGAVKRSDVSEMAGVEERLSRRIALDIVALVSRHQSLESL
jgi:hypothetical protein